MQKNGLVYLIHTYIYKYIYKIVEEFINNAHLQFRQNIYIRDANVYIYIYIRDANYVVT